MTAQELIKQIAPSVGQQLPPGFEFVLLITPNGDTRPVPMTEVGLCSSMPTGDAMMLLSAAVKHSHSTVSDGSIIVRRPGNPGN